MKFSINTAPLILYVAVWQERSAKGSCLMRKDMESISKGCIAKLLELIMSMFIMWCMCLTSYILSLNKILNELFAMVCTISNRIFHFTITRYLYLNIIRMTYDESDIFLRVKSEEDYVILVNYGFRLDISTSSKRL